MRKFVQILIGLMLISAGAFFVAQSVIGGQKTLKIYEPSGTKYIYKWHYVTEEDVAKWKQRWGVREDNKNYNIIVDGHGTGLAPPSEDEYNSMIGKIIQIDDVLNPPTRGAVDLSQDPRFPKVGNQGGQGSCASWAAGYYANGYLQAKDYDWTDASEGNPEHLMSPAWVYNKVNGGQDSGSSLSAPLDLICYVGEATMATMPYDDTDYLSWGSEDAWREAPLYRGDTYVSVDLSNINVIKSYIDQGIPVIFGINASQYDNGFADGNYIISSQEYSSSSLNHAQTIIGYDDGVGDDGEIGAFKVVNSWGSSWGDHGFYWITYDCMQEIASYSPAYVLQDKVDYEPSLLGVWHLNPAGERDVSVELGIGSPSSPIDTRTPSDYWDGGSSNFPEFMCIDISEFKSDFDNGNYDFFLTIGSGWWGTSDPSTIVSFKIELYETGYVPGFPDQISPESPDVPASNQYSDATVTVHFEPAPLSITLINPHGGQRLRGGSTVNIEWHCLSKNYALSDVSVTLQYSYDGINWHNIATTTADNSPYPWTLPKMNTSNFQIRALASDPSGNNANNTTGKFTIDSAPPHISSTSPADMEMNVPTDTRMFVVNFNESMNFTTVENSITIHPSVPLKVIPGDSDSSVKVIVGKFTGNWNESSSAISAYGQIVSAQTFTPQYTAEIYEVWLYMFKIGSPPDNAVLEIREVNSTGYPVGNVLGSAEVSPSQVSTSPSWVKFTFSTPVSVNAGTKYGLALYLKGYGGDTDNRYRWCYIGEDVYPGGNAYQYNDLSGSWEWHSFAGFDTCFLVFYEPPLSQNTWYGVKVSSTVRDYVGNAMGNDYEFWFTTGSEGYKVYGVVSEGGNPLAGVTVYLRNNETGEEISTTTNSTGEYSFDLSSLTQGYHNGTSIYVYAVYNSQQKGVASSVNLWNGGSQRIDIDFSAVPEINTLLIFSAILFIAIFVRKRI